MDSDAIKSYLQKDPAFWVLLITSIILIVASFCIPPVSIIDGSVLAAVGLLLGFGALNEIRKALIAGRSATFTHGNTSVVIKNEEDADILDQDQINNEVEDVE